MHVTNEADIALPLAVWLLDDTYDYIEGVENYISVTTLMRPIRQIVLPARIPYAERKADVQEFIARKLGNAIHDSIEKAWVHGYERSLRLMGYPQAVIDRICINPTDAEMEAFRAVGHNPIPIYLEIREMRQHAGYTIGGKFDLVTEGIVQDNKSTSAWSWAKGTRDEDHCIQMSLYRWIDAHREHPRITEDYGKINYIFTDWSKGMAKSVPSYPERRVMDKIIPLMSLEDTQQWVDNKLAVVQKYSHVAEENLPFCTDEELWRSDPQYKYYADPTKTAGRSTKNFDNLADANAFMASKGGKGIVVTKPGEVKACGYCPAFHACTQKDLYLV